MIRDLIKMNLVLRLSGRMLMKTLSSLHLISSATSGLLVVRRQNTRKMKIYFRRTATRLWGFKGMRAYQNLISRVLH